MRNSRVAGLAAMALLALGVPPAGAEVLPESGPLPKVTMERLLLIDATHKGSRVVAVGDRGYIVLSDDNGKTWRRARSPAAPVQVVSAHRATSLSAGQAAQLMRQRASWII